MLKLILKSLKKKYAFKLFLFIAKSLSTSLSLINANYLIVDSTKVGITFNDSYVSYNTKKGEKSE